VRHNHHTVTVTVVTMVTVKGLLLVDQNSQRVAVRNLDHAAGEVGERGARRDSEYGDE
jgi:hypothetical protein